ncbi:MAG: hypothetical protein KR126chlam6_00018 [Candidatus Anoxychlamydiales bacterium]|nr:hypothetical protein [Candidatus Anoxychlamydiales bacterium]
MASKVCSLFFKANSSDSTQRDNPTDKVAKKINYWAVASAIFLIAGAAATTVGAIIISKIILISGISFLALSLLASVKASKVNSSAQDKAPKDSEVDASKTATPKKYDPTDPETIQNHFQSAVLLNNIEGVKELIKKGADVNKPKDRDGQKPLMIATQNGYTQIMEILIANGANVNAKDNEGVTALMYAVRNGHEDIVLKLIKKGADIDAKDNEGRTANLKTMLLEK